MRIRLLLFLVVGNHEVDGLGDAGLARAGRLIARNDELRHRSMTA